MLDTGPGELIEAECECGKTLRADPSLIGQTIQCSVCRRPVLVPDPKAASPEVDQRTHALIGPEVQTGIRQYLYWLLPLAFFPLAIDLGQKPESINKRIDRAIARAPRAVQEKIDRMEDEGSVTLDNVISLFPRARLDDQAWLPRTTRMHWLFAAVSAGLFLTILVFLFAPGTTQPWQLLLVGAFTGTVGIAILLLSHRLGFLALLIRFSVQRAADPGSDFLASWAGFTFGVGLVEELCKLMPLLWLYFRHGQLSWRVCCAWGLASGVGFGVSEGITYSADLYNGICSAEIYVVRFLSCVALHAVWSASAGISLFHCQHLLAEMQRGRGPKNPAFYARQESGSVVPVWGMLDAPSPRVSPEAGERLALFAMIMARVLIVVMFLHGLYDSLLTRDIKLPALLVAIVSFSWLAWQIEHTRSKEAAPVAPAPANA
jgi:RsiW-degrading membrane proteinase PrsW (M82 family)